MYAIDKLCSTLSTYIAATEESSQALKDGQKHLKSVRFEFTIEALTLLQIVSRGFTSPGFLEKLLGPWKLTRKPVQLSLIMQDLMVCKFSLSLVSK